MNIKEAIKVNEETKLYLEEGGLPLSTEAVQLGVEALKREQKYRQDHPDVAPWLLPGETED